MLDAAMNARHANERSLNLQSTFGVRKKQAESTRGNLGRTRASQHGEHGWNECPGGEQKAKNDGECEAPRPAGDPAGGDARAGRYVIRQLEEDEQAEEQ